MDTDAAGIYFSPNAPVTSKDLAASAVVIGTTMGQHQTSTPTSKHYIPGLPAEFPMEGHIMPGFAQTLMGIGPI